jgi:GR25 family glycosyltransferase involved in LPS biosynthesis
MKTIVINLDRASDRREKITSQLNSQNIEFLLYSGFDAQNLTNKTFTPKITNGICRVGENFKLGEIGCTLSHIGAITMAKALNWEYVIILEDDIIICKDFKVRLERLFKMVPKNWEHIFLSGHVYNFRPLVTPTVVPSPKTSGTFSYIIRNTAYDKAIKYLSSLQTTTDDLYEQMKLISYIMFPFFSYPILDYSYCNNESQIGKEHMSKKFYTEYL